MVCRLQVVAARSPVPASASTSADPQHVLQRFRIHGRLEGLGDPQHDRLLVTLNNRSDFCRLFFAFRRLP